MEAHQGYFAGMVAGANKDGVITAREHEVLTAVAQALGIPAGQVPTVNETSEICHEIPPGSAVCFTGTFVDQYGNPISKSRLGEMAMAAGLRVVNSVTRGNCDLLVAVDPHSNSGKARKARDYGKPIMSSNRFLEIVSDVQPPAEY